MRILLVSHNFPPEELAGTEIQTYNLAKELIKSGDEVFVVHRGNNLNVGNYHFWLKIYDRIPIFVINNQCLNLSFQRTYSDENIDSQFEKILNLVKPDIVHITHLMYLSFGIIKVIKKNGIPIVLTLMDYWMLCAEVHLRKRNYEICYQKTVHDCSICIERQGFPYNKQFIIERDKMVLYLLDQIDVLISTSIFLKNKFEELAKSRIESIHIIPDSINIENFNVKLKKPIIERNKLQLGFFGFIDYHKGLHLLLAAFNKLDQTKSDLYIRGKINEKYKRFLNKRYPWWREYYKGPYPNVEVINLLREHVDLLVVPSVVFENCPTVINESLLAGVPVIGADLGGIPELIDVSKTGLLFEPLNANDLLKKLKSIIENPKLITEMKNNIKNISIKSFGSQVTDIKAIYSSLVSSYGITPKKKDTITIFKKGMKMQLQQISSKRYRIEWFITSILSLVRNFIGQYRIRGYINWRIRSIVNFINKKIPILARKQLKL